MITPNFSATPGLHGQDVAVAVVVKVSKSVGILKRAGLLAGFHLRCISDMDLREMSIISKFAWSIERKTGRTKDVSLICLLPSVVPNITAQAEEDKCIIFQ